MEDYLGIEGQVPMQNSVRQLLKVQRTVIRELEEKKEFITKVISEEEE